MTVSAVVKVKQRRADRLGASDAPVVLGLVPGKGPINTWLRLTGRAQPEPATDLMEFGIEYEPVIRGRYVERTGAHVWVPAESMLHPAVDFIQATPDGVVLREPWSDASTPPREIWSHGLEVKAPKARSRSEWGDSEVPARVLVQVVVQMAVLDLPFVDVVAEIDREYVQRRVHRDPELETDVIGALGEFWQHVINDTPPPVDETLSYAEYLKAKLARAANTLEATGPIDALIGRWREVEIALKGNETERDLVRNLVMAEMDKHSASSVMSKHGRIYMQSGRVDYDDKALAQDLCNRLQLRGEAIDFAAERERFKKTGNPFPKRPNAWTAKGK